MDVDFILDALGAIGGLIADEWQDLIYILEKVSWKQCKEWIGARNDDKQGHQLGNNDCCQEKGEGLGRHFRKWEI